MTAGPADTVGPPPFRFTPSQPRMQSAAFSRTFKLAALGLVGGTIAWFVSLWRSGRLGSDDALFGWGLCALALMAATLWKMFSSRTTLDGEALHQTWLWDKKMELRELAYARMVRVRGLDWLVAPRIYVRTLLGKFAVFHAADPALLAEFERLVVELRAFRGFR